MEQMVEPTIVRIEERYAGWKLVAVWVSLVAGSWLGVLAATLAFWKLLKIV